MERLGHRTNSLAVAVLASFVLGAMAAPGARADQVTLGPDLNALSNPLGLQPGCGGAGRCTFLQIDANGPTVVSPVNGVITTWSLRTYAATGALYRLRVLLGPAGLGQTFTALRSTPVAPAFGAAGIHTVGASLPIAAGDRIALGGESSAPGQVFVNPPGGSAQVTWATGIDGPPDGGSGTSNNGPAIGVLGLSATVSYCAVPDVDGKKLKKAKKAVRRAQCKPKPKPRSRGKEGRVFKQKPAPGTTVAPGRRVKLFFGD